MIQWSHTELKYFAEYVKLTNAKFFDYFTSISDEEFEEQMCYVLLILTLYNKKVIVYETFTKKAVDVIDFKDVDSIPSLYSWIPSNFHQINDYLEFVDSIEFNEDTGEIDLQW